MYKTKFIAASEMSELRRSQIRTVQFVVNMAATHRYYVIVMT